jgi:hypothetical protein
MERVISAITTAVVGAFATLTVLQVAPIKINPWTWIARAIGRAINAEVIDKVGKLETEVKTIKRNTEEHEAKSARVRILRFGDEILHDVKHSQEHFNQVLLDITEYEEYCSKHPEFRNNVTGITTKRIMEMYERCLKDNNFL